MEKTCCNNEEGVNAEFWVRGQSLTRTNLDVLDVTDDVSDMSDDVSDVFDDVSDMSDDASECHEEPDNSTECYYCDNHHYQQQYDENHHRCFGCEYEAKDCECHYSCHSLLMERNCAYLERVYLVKWLYLIREQNLQGERYSKDARVQRRYGFLETNFIWGMFGEYIEGPKKIPEDYDWDNNDDDSNTTMGSRDWKCEICGLLNLYDPDDWSFNHLCNNCYRY